MKRITVLCLVAVLAIGLCACRSNPPTDSSNLSYVPPTQVQSGSTISLLYAFGDSFNPYAAKTEQNRKLCSLLYEPLVRVDNVFEAHYALAQDITLEGTTCTVDLKNTYFTDGSPVTANDVIHSFNLARASATAYASYFGGVASVSAAGNSVVFTLAYSDPQFINLLTFPVLKAGSEGGHNEDGVEIAPIGSGRYYLDSTAKKMLINDNYYGKKGEIKEILLINAPDDDSVSHYVEVGACDLYFTDISDGNIVRMSGKKSSVNLNNLVYIGVNHSKGRLSDPAIRQALSAALDRTELAKTPYYGNAVAAPGFFHPDFKPCIGYQTIQLTADNKICIENLEKIGYNRLDSDGFYLNEKGDRLEFDLLVNEENSARVAAAKLISKQAAEVGIKINVNAVDSELYLAAIKANNFELYIGEVKVSQNMDMSELVLPGGRAAFGILAPKKTTDESGAASLDYTDVIEGIKKGEDLVSSLATSLITDMPVIPLLFRSSLLFYSKNVSDVSGASAYDPLLSINNFI